MTQAQESGGTGTPERPQPPDAGEAAVSADTPPAPPVVPPSAATAPVEAFPNWKAPQQAPTWPVLVSAVVVGAATAVAFPVEAWGIGHLIVAVVTAVTIALLARHVWLVRREPDRSPPPRVAAAPRAWRSSAIDAAWGVAAVLLAGVSAVRDAEWLVGLCLFAAVCSAAMAVAGRHFRSVAFVMVAVPLGGLRALPWIARSARRAQEGDSTHKGVRIAISLGVGALLLLIFTPLLAGADPVFGKLIDALVPTFDEEGMARWLLLFPLAAGCVLGAGFLMFGPPVRKKDVSTPLRLTLLEWALPIGLLVGLFALFVGVQFVTLFGSDDYVQRTTGLTYAEYARNGFWQLLVVALLALPVVQFSARYLPATTPADRAAKRGLLAAFVVLTLVIVASAINRMALYHQAYGYSTDRIFALTVELWLSACFLLVLVSVLRLAQGPILRQMAALGVVALLALAVFNPERFVAEQNIARAPEKLDTGYLSGLSADAVPALVTLPPETRCTALSSLENRLDDEEDWQSWNASRATAREVLTTTGC